jgi:hypothetical protein
MFDFSGLREHLETRANPCFQKIQNLFFLLKINFLFFGSF